MRNTYEAHPLPTEAQGKYTRRESQRKASRNDHTQGTFARSSSCPFLWLIPPPCFPAKPNEATQYPPCAQFAPVAITCFKNRRLFACDEIYFCLVLRRNTQASVVMPAIPAQLDFIAFAHLFTPFLYGPTQTRSLDRCLPVWFCFHSSTS